MQCILFLVALLLCCEEDDARKVENRNVRVQASLNWWQWPCYKIFLVNQIKVSGCLTLWVVWCGLWTAPCQWPGAPLITMVHSGHCHLPSHRKHSSPVRQQQDISITDIFYHHNLALITQSNRWEAERTIIFLCVNFSCNKADNMASNFLFRCVSVWQEMTSLLGNFC